MGNSTPSPVTAKPRDQTVAVIMSVYANDRPHFLHQSLESLLVQVPLAPRIFIYVDGPIPDPTRHYMDSIQAEVERIVHGEKNVGLAHALNRLIDLIVADETIKYIARMDADDISMPDRIARQKAYLEANADVAVVGTWCVEIDALGTQLGLKRTPSSPSEVRAAAIYRNPVNHPTAFIRKEVFASGHRYSPNVGLTEDYNLWVELLAAGHGIANLPTPLLCFRRSPTFLKRRGGIKTAKMEFATRWHAMTVLHRITLKGLLYAVAIFIFRICPTPLSHWIYSLDRKQPKPT